MSKRINEFDYKTVHTTKIVKASSGSKSSTHISYDNVPTWRKLTLTPKEASMLSNIPVSWIKAKIKDPNCPFVFVVGKKVLIKREAFELYIKLNPAL